MKTLFDSDPQEIMAVPECPVVEVPVLTEKEIKAIRWLQQNDVRLFINRTKMGQARKAMNGMIEEKVGAKTFTALVAEHCVYYRNAKRKGPSTAVMLNSAGWDKLRAAATQMEPLYRGLGIDAAVQLVCLKRKCNRSLLKGLPENLRTW